MRRVSLMAILLSYLFLTGCSAFQAAEPLAANEQYVCQPGSALKYRKPVETGWPGYWVPVRPGGSCKSL